MIICAETYNNNVFAHNISMMENGKWMKETKRK